MKKIVSTLLLTCLSATTFANIMMVEKTHTTYLSGRAACQANHIKNKLCLPIYIAKGLWHTGGKKYNWAGVIFSDGGTYPLQPGRVIFTYATSKKTLQHERVTIGPQLTKYSKIDLANMFKSISYTGGLGKINQGLYCTPSGCRPWIKNNIAQLTAYCRAHHGTVESMRAEFNTSMFASKFGLSQAFCTFMEPNHGFVAIGLKTYASKKPSIAATIIKNLGPINPKSSLWSGPHKNPSANVCQNLGGSEISYYSAGGFSDQLGEGDICVFGDGSMVSGWSLIYMENGRAGYRALKNSVHAKPIHIHIPQ